MDDHDFFEQPTEHEAVTWEPMIPEAPTEHDAATENELMPEEVADWLREAITEEIPEYEQWTINEDAATPEIPEAMPDLTMEGHEREADTAAASSALNEGDRSVSKLMHLDVEAIAALELLGAHDNGAKSRLVMKLLLKKAQLKNPSAFVTRAAWSALKRAA